MSKLSITRREAAGRPRRGLAVAVVGGLALLAGSAGLRSLLAPQLSLAIDGSFHLVDASGRTRTEKSFGGRYLLMFFGYTGCKDVCPETLTEMSRALDRVDPEGERIQPLFVTIDPNIDTSERLASYTASFSPRLIGLTGTPGQLGRVESRFHVVVEKDRDGDEGGYDHSALIYLLAPGGRFIAPISALADRTVLEAALRRYVASPGPDRS